MNIYFKMKLIKLCFFFGKRKKQNLNHLLNFNYAPRDRSDAATFMRSGNLSKCHVKRVKYNKEQFLQAK